MKNPVTYPYKVRGANVHGAGGGPNGHFTPVLNKGIFKYIFNLSNFVLDKKRETGCRRMQGDSEGSFTAALPLPLEKEALSVSPRLNTIVTIANNVSTSKTNGIIENLNWSLVNGYARSRQRLNGALVKGDTDSSLSGIIEVSALICCMYGAEVPVSLWLLSKLNYLNASLQMDLYLKSPFTPNVSVNAVIFLSLKTMDSLHFLTVIFSSKSKIEHYMWQQKANVKL